MKKYFLIILFLLTVRQGIYSQYVFRHWDTVDGLSDNQIRNITQTPDGRIAIRTLSNLNIYNGATFEHFYYDRRKVYQWDYTRFLTDRYIFKEYYDRDDRLWMKAPDYLLLFDLKSNRFVYDIDRELSSFGIDQKIKNLFIDDSKNFWFLTEDNTFFFYNISTQKLQTVEQGNSPSAGQYGIPYELAQYKNLYWIMYSGGLLRCWDSVSGEFILHDTSFTGKISEASNRLFIRLTATGDVWIMHNNGVSFYNWTDKTWKEAASIEGPSNFFTCMDLDADGNAWVGTSWSGLRKIDGRTHRMEVLSGLKLENGGTLTNDIQCVFVDRDCGLWTGTLWQGICYWHPGMKKFKLVQTMHGETPVTNESIRCFLEDDDGTILFGTLYQGVLRYHPATGKISKAFERLLPDDLCLSLYRDSKKRLWVGTFLNGFYCIDGENVKIYNKSMIDWDVYANQNVSRAIFEDAGGRFWVSVANQGVGELDIHTGKIHMLRDRHPEISLHKKIFNFYAVDDCTFAAYGENGIFYYDTRNDKTYIPDTDDPDNPKFAGSSISYNCIFRDSRSLEWFCTEQGIRIWDEKRKKAYVLNAENGLSNSAAVSILEDSNGICWAALVNGLVKIEISETAAGYEFSLIDFDANDGLQNGKFFEKAALKSKNGDLYFGGYNGFNVFHPDEITYNRSKNKPVFTAFNLFNSPVREGAGYNGRVILEKPVGYTKEIRLKYRENFISFEFSGLNYVNPSHTYYRYRLENYDRDWTEISSSGPGTVSYTGLPSGIYRLTVYAANNDKIWGDEPACIDIIISPPFWATVYAYIFYLLMIAGGFFGMALHLTQRNRKRREQRQAMEKQRQKEELEQMKFRFFTNISHEFRTPLTLIMTPLDTLIKQLTDEYLKQKLTAIYRNAENMLGLINQLLDFRKLEMGGEKLNFSYDDIVKFTQYVHVSFREIAENKSVHLVFESESEQLFMRFDRDKIRKILHNLYSNALKFTPAGGLISVTVKNMEYAGRECVGIEIADTGCGIAEKDLQAIFDRFYQCADDGTDKIGSGIGLHLVKEYVELHGGRISVSSTLNQGSTFSICIPADLQTSDIKPDMTVEKPLSASPENGGRKQKTLLIVEDNSEFRHFLAEQLSDKFHVLQAADGKQGEEIAAQKFPDLIVSDLMMPVLNGLEMCERLKTTIETSHIPIILLTARLSNEAKIESYRAGADSYIAKPFSFDVLLTRIETLIEQQEKRKKLFHKTIKITPSSITTTS
ncbi:MAG: response regulator, partial [Dysgonamonadaceae bacterium]|nr:response regulator [Dysgonamonadaceae bacterium]